MFKKKNKAKLEEEYETLDKRSRRAKEIKKELKLFDDIADTYDRNRLLRLQVGDATKQELALVQEEIRFKNELENFLESNSYNSTYIDELKKFVSFLNLRSEIPNQSFQVISCLK